MRRNDWSPIDWFGFAVVGVLGSVLLAYVALATATWWVHFHW